MLARIKPALLNGTINAIESKAHAHRVIVASALADKPTVIHLNELSEDIEATIRCIEALGASVKAQDGILTVTPIKIKDGGVLDCGECATTLRHLLPVAGVLGEKVTFDGTEGLQNRPMLSLHCEMEKNGCDFSTDGEFPMGLSGKLESGSYSIMGDVGAQSVSGLIMALPLCDGKSKITINGALKSKPYIDLTISVLKKFGIVIKEDFPTEDDEDKPMRYIVEGNQKYVSPGEISVEGDWSSAALWLCAGAIGGEVTVKGLQGDSAQGEKVITEILENMGAEIEINGESVTARKGKYLCGLSIDAVNCPDLVPVLCTVAANANSLTEIYGAARLRLREVDRLEAITTNFEKLTVAAVQTDEGIIVWGNDVIRGGAVDSFGDHRIATAMALTSINATGEILLQHAEAVSKSYPKFFEHFNSLGGKVDVI